jgi:hypothetical protein
MPMLGVTKQRVSILVKEGKCRHVGSADDRPSQRPDAYGRSEGLLWTGILGPVNLPCVAALSSG